MRTFLKRAVAGLLAPFSLELVRRGAGEFSQQEERIIRSVAPYTMTNRHRIGALIQAVKYIVQNGIDGAIVECGVWKGGSILAAAQTLQMLDARRDLYLFDTFSGMTAPTSHDVSTTGLDAAEIFQKKQDWCAATMDEVRSVVLSSGYDAERVHLVPGMVEETLPAQAPSQVALLRLDTDWYESTRHEMIHLFPRLSHRGVLIIDDYGMWQGSRKAVDEYIQEQQLCLLLNRIDHSARIAVKAAPR